MDLVDLMVSGVDPREQALDHLERIITLYQSPDDAVQDEAMARAITFCGKEFGGYKAGLLMLARRREETSDEQLDALLDAMRLREEADDPGSLIRLARDARSAKGRADAGRAAVIARYGSLEAARGPTPVEMPFVEATRHLVVADGDGPGDAWAPLAGWSLPWHDIPPELRHAVASACPLPTTVLDARAEAVVWMQRREELSLLGDGRGNAALPTACAARHRLVEALWSRELPAASAADFEARLVYWADLGDDDGTGYGVLLGDLRRLNAAGGFTGGGERTKDKCRRLKAEHPEWSLGRIGKELGISRQAVHKHLK
ncbi:HTH domain-containing protein [Magnetospirillum sp. UT-4]|uniref:HTH domain-containing protein n=1 Tax=Magnetospirillum sp. UT-4 TaxID=2681467 RepID=UPI0013803D24|nr:HTH domain-containing protein [Magnetospirillum sp. UT-4]CAA7616054.1 conserved hypothetical protein [Magnetospirillum sp. UT-4]